MVQKDEISITCPVPHSDYQQVLLAHGGGGTLMHRLLSQVFYPAFNNPILAQQGDSAVLQIGGQRLAFTTDSYVVQPLFFPGGDIGTLAINGTVNDLAMCGARPLYLSAGFILEEGLPLDTLRLIAASMRSSADIAGVQLVTGDTKVVEKGKGDSIFINTTGIGVIEHDQDIQPRSISPGDSVILNGDIGRHGMAIIAAREKLTFENPLESDCAPLASLVMSLLDAGIEIHCMRDLTRGGLASGVVEIAATSGAHITLEERAIPVQDEVRGACEIMGFDPLYVANEGKFIIFVPENDAQEALSVMSSHPEGRQAAIIGRVTEQQDGIVTMTTCIGSHRIIDMLSGEQLPRIC